jgi:predicted nucleic acid-binding protein
VSVLVDSSVWIHYFRGTPDKWTGSGRDLDELIDENLISTNDLILAELLPALIHRRQRKLISLLKAITRPPMQIDWEELVQMQVACLRDGINKIGLPDLIITQHAIQHDLELFTLDSHFKRLSRHVPLRLR